MKYKTNTLSKMLKGVVDRKDSSILLESLPPKREFYITIRMTPFQKFMYVSFLEKLSIQDRRFVGAGQV
jgi:transcriptional regulator ATRX